MRRSILIPVLALFGLTAAIQAAGQPPHYRSPGQYQSPSRGSSADFEHNELLFARVRSDIGRAESNLPVLSSGRNRFDLARSQLNELERRWADNTHQPSTADALIATLSGASSSSGMLPSDRERLTRDMLELREFRDTHP